MLLLTSLHPPSPRAAVVMCHVRSVLLNAPDNGWVHTLAMEVDCMRCQYANERQGLVPAALAVAAHRLTAGLQPLLPSFWDGRIPIKFRFCYPAGS